MATKKFSDYAVEGQNVTLTYDNVNDTVTIDVVVDKSDVGLSNVDNTSDANKPISTATQTALNLKQNSLVSGTNIKTINSNTLLGSGDLVIDKTSVGLSNVVNVDTTNATNISSGTLGDARLSANVTTQGNTFNAANKLVQLDGTAKLPAVDGSQLTNLPTPATPTLASVTTAGNTTTNAITVGGLTVDTDTLFVDATNNRVGIGTVTPSQPLHIIGRTRIASSTGTSLHLYNDGSTSLIDSLTNGNAAHDLRISAQNISFYSGASYGTVYAKLFNTGNFALGTNPTDAGFKLDVNGTARVQQNLTIFSNVRDNRENSLIVQSASSVAANRVLTIGNGTYANINFSISQSVLIGTTTSIDSSKFTIESTTQGFLPPRMTTTQKNAIATPAAGLVVYDTTDNKHYGYNGTTWNAFY